MDLENACDSFLVTQQQQAERAAAIFRAVGEVVCMRSNQDSDNVTFAPEAIHFSNLKARNLTRDNQAFWKTVLQGLVVRQYNFKFETPLRISFTGDEVLFFVDDEVLRFSGEPVDYIKQLAAQAADLILASWIKALDNSSYWNPSNTGVVGLTVEKRFRG